MIAITLIVLVALAFTPLIVMATVWPVPLGDLPIYLFATIWSGAIFLGAPIGLGCFRFCGIEGMRLG